ncbi:MAG: aromatic ring-hydroxylating dioxygenase subunit alpha [Burkholderiaceae bacterium]
MRDPQDTLEITRRAFAHFTAKTTDQAPAPMSLEVDAYVDPQRYQRELQRIFRELPVVVALSLELPAPGSFRSTEIADVPVLVTRDKTGRARAFINVCRHRGAPVCQQDKGRADRFVCRYHAWTFGNDGRLIAIAGESTFGEVGKDALGLTELDCHERSGLIWAVLTPGLTVDFDGFLAGFDRELATLELGSWHLHEQRDLDGPGWKICWDGYLEAYHHNTLHANTVGKHTVGNLTVHDTWGAHQRITFARRTIAELAGIPSAQWQEPGSYVRLIHSIFPNTSISGVLGDHCLVSQMFPGKTPESTITRQTILVAKPPETDEQLAATRAFSELVRQAVVEEDYDMGMRIQRGLRSKGNQAFLFGRNEPGLQHYHSWVRRYCADGGRVSDER